MEPIRSKSNSTSPSLACLLNPTSPLPQTTTTTTTTTSSSSTSQYHSNSNSNSNSMHNLTHPMDLNLNSQQLTSTNPRPSKRLKTNTTHSTITTSTSRSPTPTTPIRPFTSSEISITNQSSTLNNLNHLSHLGNQSTSENNSLVNSPNLPHKKLSISHSRPSTSTTDPINPHRSASHPIILSTPHSHHHLISSRSIQESESEANSIPEETHPSTNRSDQSRPRSITPTFSQRSTSLPTATNETDQPNRHPTRNLDHIHETIESPSQSQPEPIVFNPENPEASQPIPPNLSMNPEPCNPLNGLEESIFGIGAYDDFIASIGRFIWSHAKPYCERNEGHLIEVEAKLGTIKPKTGSGERIYFPVENESALINLESNRFETNMTEKQHKSFNELLNIRVMETNEVNYKGSKIKYSHLRDIDEFYENRIRVRRSQRNGEVKESIVKQKLGSLDVTCPSRLFDFRVSVNLERPVPLPPPDAVPHYRRIKDRLSYEHQICQIDLTQVKTDDPNVKPQHELEVEIKDIPTLLRLGGQWNDGLGDPSYLTFLNVWLNNVRLLIRNSIEP